MKTMSEKKRESGSSAERMYLKEDNTFDQMQPSYRQGVPESKPPTLSWRTGTCIRCARVE